MEIKKLNCTACGAPISVPDDMDYINCAACGSFLAIQRGEGYVALKVAEKISRAIEDSGRGTQEVIRQGSQDTQVELRRMQLQYELSTADLKLSNIQSEIRSTPATKEATKKLNQLRILEYEALGRVRDVKARILQLGEQTPQGLIPGLTEQVNLLQSMVQVAAYTGQSSSQIRNVQQGLQQEISRLTKQIEDLRVKIITSPLKYFKQANWPSSNQAELGQVLKAIDEDLVAVSRLPGSAERTRVQQHLEGKRAEYYRQWTQLEDTRIRGMMSSGGAQQVSTNDTAALRASLDVVQQDIRMLIPMADNPVAKGHLEALRKQESKLIRQIEEINKQAAREAAKLAQAQQRAAAQEAAARAAAVQAQQRAAQAAAKQAARAAQDTAKAASGSSSGPGWLAAIGIAIAAFFAGTRQQPTPPPQTTHQPSMPAGATAIAADIKVSQPAPAVSEPVIAAEIQISQSAAAVSEPVIATDVQASQLATSVSEPVIPPDIKVSQPPVVVSEQAAAGEIFVNQPVITPAASKPKKMPILLIAILGGLGIMLALSCLGMIIVALTIPSENLKEPGMLGVAMLPLPIASILAGVAILFIVAPKAGFRFLGMKPAVDGVNPVSINAFRGLVAILIAVIGLIISFSLGLLGNQEKETGTLFTLLSWCLGPIITLVLAGLSVLLIKAPRMATTYNSIPVPEQFSGAQTASQTEETISADQSETSNPVEIDDHQTAE